MQGGRGGNGTCAACPRCGLGLADAIAVPVGSDQRPAGFYQKRTDPVLDDIRDAVRKLCADFPGTYWQAKDRDRAYPAEFVEALTDAGWLSVLIPEEFGGSGLGLVAATAILEEIHRSGCNGGACHAQMYVMGTLLKHGTDAQKARYLPQVASGARCVCRRLA